MFVNKEQKFALVGDVLFRGSIGRTDFPYGDHDTLITAINTKRLPLGHDYAFICGHGLTRTSSGQAAFKRHSFVEGDGCFLLSRVLQFQAAENAAFVGEQLLRLPEINGFDAQRFGAAGRQQTHEPPGRRTCQPFAACRTGPAAAPLPNWLSATT